jgi:hypothetical protein
LDVHPGCEYFSVPDPEVKKTPGSGSGSETLDFEGLHKQFIMVYWWVLHMESWFAIPVFFCQRKFVIFFLNFNFDLENLILI